MRMRFSQVEASTEEHLLSKLLSDGDGLVQSTALSMPNQSQVESLQLAQEEEVRAEKYKHVALRLEEELASHHQVNARLHDEMLHYKQELSCHQELNEQNIALHSVEELATQRQINARLLDETSQYKEDLARQKELCEQSCLAMSEMKELSKKEIDDLKETQTATLLHYNMQRNRVTEEMKCIETLRSSLHAYEQAMKESSEDQRLLHEEIEHFGSLIRNANAAASRAEAKAAAVHEENNRARADIAQIEAARQRLSQFMVEVQSQNQNLLRNADISNRKLTMLEEQAQARDARVNVIWQEYDSVQSHLRVQEEMNQNMHYLARHAFVEFRERRAELLDELHSARLNPSALLQDSEVQTNETEFPKAAFKAPPAGSKRSPPSAFAPATTQSSSGMPQFPGPSSSFNTQATPVPQAKHSPPPLDQLKQARQLVIITLLGLRVRSCGINYVS